MSGVTLEKGFVVSVGFHSKSEPPSRIKFLVEPTEEKCSGDFGDGVVDETANHLSCLFEVEVLYSGGLSPPTLFLIERSRRRYGVIRKSYTSKCSDS